MDKNTLYEYLLEHYGFNEPIFCSRLDIPGELSKNLNQTMKRLTDTGRIERFDRGIYYISYETKYCGRSVISPFQVTERKYMRDKDKKEVYGYFSGLHLQNSWGLTTQMANTYEIVTNNEHSKKRTVVVGGHKFILKKSRVQITKENYEILELFEVLSDPYTLKLSEGEYDNLLRVVTMRKYTWDEVSRYVDVFPECALKAMLITGVYDVINLSQHNKKELRTLVNNIKDSNQDFVTEILQYVGTKKVRLNAVVSYIKMNPNVKSSDVVKFVSEQRDFFEYMYGSARMDIL